MKSLPPANEKIAVFTCQMLQPLMVASHLLVMEELRSIQGRPFDTDLEFRRLMQCRFDAGQLLQKENEAKQLALRHVLERRTKNK